MLPACSAGASAATAQAKPAGKPSCFFIGER
jgi:hypothetical protein